ITQIVNIVFNGKIKDSFSGLKCLRVNKFLNLLKENEAAIEPIICMCALKYNMRIKMSPIDYNERVGGVSKENMLLGIKYIAPFLKTIWQMKTGNSKAF